MFSLTYQKSTLNLNNFKIMTYLSIYKFKLRSLKKVFFLDSNHLIDAW